MSEDREVLGPTEKRVLGQLQALLGKSRLPPARDDAGLKDINYKEILRRMPISLMSLIERNLERQAGIDVSSVLIEQELQSVSTLKQPTYRSLYPILSCASLALNSRSTKLPYFKIQNQVPISKPQPPPKRIFLKSQRKRSTVVAISARKKSEESSSYHKVKRLGSLSKTFQNKYINYSQFVVGLAYSYGLVTDQESKSSPKYFVGRGNNSSLIRNILKGRFWLEETDSISQADIVWTQIQQKSVFARQSVSSCEPRPASGFLQRKNKLFSLEEEEEISKYLKLTPRTGADRMSLLASIQSPKVLHNHLEGNSNLGNKRALYYHLRHYCRRTGQDLFDKVPITFHIRGVDDSEFRRFRDFFKQREGVKGANIWIVKPGQNSNRGSGITVISKLDTLTNLLKQQKASRTKTYIVQQYLTRPLLYNKRKFDIRHYLLVTSIRGTIRAYWYSEGYIRTSSREFSTEDLDDNFVHLTNDAVQRQDQSYGRFEEGNKVSYSEFQRYLDLRHTERKWSVRGSLLPRMRALGLDAVRATFLALDPSRREHNFQVFGLDFMVDQQFKPWLIEVNTNPCLECSCPLLSRLIPAMLEQAMRLVLDPLFPPTSCYASLVIPENIASRVKFELFFHEGEESPKLKQLLLPLCRQGQLPYQCTAFQDSKN